MTAILVPIVIALVALIGSLAFARTIERDGPTPIGRWIKIAGGVVFALGVARGGWLAVRGTELPSMPSVSAMGADMVDGMSTDELRTACLGSGAVANPANLRAHCECTVSAVEAVRRTEPTFAVDGPSPLVLDGTDTGIASFRASYGQCALPHLREWISADCRASCDGDPGACARGCTCIATEIARGKTAAEVGEIYWPNRPGIGEADYTMHNLVVQASMHCPMR